MSSAWSSSADHPSRRGLLQLGRSSFPSLPSSTHARVALLVGLAGVGSLAPWTLRGIWRDFPFVAFEVLVVAVVLVGVGSLLVGHPRSSTSGWWLIVSAAFLMLLPAGVGQAGLGPITSWFASSLIWLVLGLVVSHFPRGQPWTREHRLFFAVAVPHLVLLTVALAVLSEPEWSGYPPAALWPTLVALPTAYTAGALLVSALDVALSAWYLRITAARLQAMAGVDRSALVPALWGVGAAVVTGVSAAVTQNVVLTQAVWAWGLFFQAMGLLAMAAAVAFAAHRVVTTRTRIAAVVRSLSTSDLASVRRVLQEGLSDPTLTLALWSAADGGCVDDRGRRVDFPDDDAYRLPLTSSDGSPLGLVTVDPRLRPHRDVVVAAVAAAGFVLENAYLQAALRARIDDVEASRAEIVEAQLAERRRVSDELHDGLEQSLLGLAARTRALRGYAEHDGSEGPPLVAATRQLVTAAEEALTLVRQVSRGLPPPLLRSEGLRAALEDVTDHLELDVDVEVDAAVEASPAVEASVDVAYLWISEALANVAKHAEAQRAWVSVRRFGSEIVIDVRDDGVGGVRDTGTALRALRRRAEGARGRVAVVSPVGRGTRVSAVLPVAPDAKSAL